MYEFSLTKPLIHFWQGSAGAETASQLHLRMTGGTLGLNGNVTIITIFSSISLTYDIAFVIVYPKVKGPYNL